MLSHPVTPNRSSGGTERRQIQRKQVVNCDKAMPSNSKAMPRLGLTKLEKGSGGQSLLKFSPPNTNLQNTKRQLPRPGSVQSLERQTCPLTSEN